nr:femAB operon family, Methicillin resistance protein [uncultured bacterium]
MVKTLKLGQALKTLQLPGLDKNLFSSKEWFNVITCAYNPKIYVKYIERDGKIDSYIVYTKVYNFLEWKICVLSYCDYCDGYVKDIGDWKLLFESLTQDFPKYRIAIRSLRDNFVRECGCFHELSREYFHILDIRPDIDTLWSNVKTTFRQKVRQASKKGVTVRICNEKELFDFYSLHVKLRKNKYRIFAQPYRFFKSIWDEFVAKNQGFLLGAFAPDGKMIGGTLYLICGNTLYYKVNTSDPDRTEYRSSNLLFWEGMKIAKERGLEFIDLGSSGYHQDGLVSFKDDTGAERMDIVHIGYHPEGYVFSKKRILKFYTWLFTLPWVPVNVTRWGSQFIYSFLA